jgi:DNA-binding NarL/FixJ family response regulator
VAEVRVLVADADPLARLAVREALTAEPALTVVAETADPETTVQAAVDEQPDVAFVDAGFGGANLPDWLEGIARAAPSTAVVVLSVSGDEEAGVEALLAGAAGYLGKAIDPGSLARVAGGIADGQPAISRHLARRVVDRLRAIAPRATGIRPVKSALSARQWEIIDLLRKGESEGAIAAQLGITSAAVRRHLRILRRKLHASTVEAVVETADRLCAEAAEEDRAEAAEEDRAEV